MDNQDRLSRELKFVINGKLETGVVRIGLPERRADDDWLCTCSISFISPEEARLPGQDSIAALMRCLQFTSNLIRGSEADGLELWWLERGDHGGF